MGMVIRLPTDAGVGVGAAFPSLTFGQFSGLFDAVFVVQEVGRSGRRSLLQATGATTSCSNANGACTTTIINAAGADDDDEVPFVVALIIVSPILFVGIVAAVYIYSKRKNGDKQTPQPVRATATNNATAYGAATPSSPPPPIPPPPPPPPSLLPLTVLPLLPPLPPLTLANSSTKVVKVRKRLVSSK